MWEKLETCPNLNLIHSRGKSFGDNFYTVRTSALNFKQPYIFYKSHPIKPICLSGRIPYWAETFNCSSQKYLRISESVCFTGNKCLKFS